MLFTPIREQPPSSRAAVCLASTVWHGILGLQLFCDDTLLAVYDRYCLKVYALHDAITHGNCTPLLQAPAAQAIHCLCIQGVTQPGANTPSLLRYAAVLGDARTLMVGDLRSGSSVGGGGASEVDRGVGGVAWGLQEGVLAYCRAEQVVVHDVVGGGSFACTLSSMVCGCGETGCIVQHTNSDSTHQCYSPIPQQHTIRTPTHHPTRTPTQHPTTTTTTACGR